MRWGFDAKRLFHNYTGLGNYSRTLVSGLLAAHEEDEIVLYTPRFSSQTRTQLFEKHPRVHLRVGPRGGSLWRTWQIPTFWSGDQLNLYHGLSHELPRGGKQPQVRQVVTMHDLIFKHYPQHYSSWDRFIYDRKWKHACQQADLVIAISEQTKRDVLAHYPITEDRIRVIYQPCDRQFQHMASQQEKQALREKYQLPAAFVLAVGALTERKNLLKALEAWMLLPADAQLPFLILGEGRAYRKKMEAFIQEKKLEHLVRFLPKMAWAEVPLLYQQASLLLYPSLFEGFGLPLLEALWSGTPVVSGQNSSLPEAGGPGSIYVDVRNPEAIAEAVQRGLGDEALRKKMIAAGRAYARQFTSERMAREIRSAYLDLL
ncbi:MAG: glycosyltransferase family 1 protein [Bacteroidota bacterium]